MEFTDRGFGRAAANRRPKVRRPNSFEVDTSSTAMDAWTTSVLKDLEHRNACVGLAGNNPESSAQWEARVAGNSNTL